MAFLYAGDQMVKIAHAARGDNRHGYRIAYCARQRDIKAVFCAVSIHRGQQDFTCAVFSHALRPFYRVDPCVLAAAMGENLPLSRHAHLGINGDNDALAAALLCGFAHELRPFYSGAVDRNLVRTRYQQLADILKPAHAAAHGHGHENLSRRLIDDVVYGIAVIRCGGDVKKTKLVRAAGIIDASLFDRIACVFQIDEVNSLDDAALRDVQTRNNADFEHVLSFFCAGNGGTADRVNAAGA